MRAKEKIEKLKGKIANIKIKIYNEVEKHYPLFNSCWHVVGYWSCDKSPFGLCLYYHFEDKTHDNCLFCGHPEERK